MTCLLLSHQLLPARPQRLQLVIHQEVLSVRLPQYAFQLRTELVGHQNSAFVGLAINGCCPPFVHVKAPIFVQKCLLNASNENWLLTVKSQTNTLSAFLHGMPGARSLQQLQSIALIFEVVSWQPYDTSARHPHQRRTTENNAKPRKTST
eukprot:scaffold278314_cov16-Prasinocladus_malaysianus.AAC.1